MNGGCGYVLKPEWMLEALLQELGEGSSPSPTVPGLETSSSLRGFNPLPPRSPRTLAVTVYSAHAQQGSNFSIFRDDLYLQLEVVGMPMDVAKRHTPTTYNSGRLRVESTYRFQVTYPEVAVLLVLLKDEDIQPGKGMDDVLGHWEVALEHLQPGDYRVMLTDRKDRTRGDRWVRLGLAWEDDDGGIKGR